VAERPWFRARASGLGWYPITWQGWLATLLGAAIFAAADIALVAHLALRHR
jgi:hypothetical protein